jgi:hypothetical protein
MSGEISPGADGEVGRLTVAALVANLSTPSRPLRLLFEIAGDEPGASYDQLVVTQSATLALSPLSTSRYALDIDLRFAPAVGDAFTILDLRSAAAIDGRFANLAEGATFTVDGVPLRITYFGGTGNDVVLTVIPEPSAACLILTTSAVRRRRRSA